MGDEITKDKNTQKKKTKKIPKRSGIAVSSGKSRKKRVSSAGKSGNLKAGTQKKQSDEKPAVQKKTTAATPVQKKSVLETVEKKLGLKKQKKNKEPVRERDLTTSSRRAKRIDRERQKIRKERLEARKAELFRTRLIMAAAALAAVLLGILLITWPGRSGGSETAETMDGAAAENAENAEAAEGTVATSEVRHFSFRVLRSDEVAGDESVLTVNQFRQILQQLYDANYILVDFYSIAGIRETEDGRVFTAAKLDIPEGKIPFVLSERDVSYSLDRIGKGYASRLIVTEDGQLTNQYQSSDGTLLQGAYDVVPVLEEFIAEHPDFSYNNARGVIGLTGYNGILGYRTSESLGKTAEEGNAYAVYGTFDVPSEIEQARPVVEALKQKGWHLASYGNNYCSYGAEYDMMVSDMEAWRSNAEDLIGGTDILLFPCETDIGDWSEYREDNRKYQYLKGLGFNYFCIEEKVNPSWLQIRPGYVRQGMKEIDSYADFEQVMAG